MTEIKKKSNDNKIENHDINLSKGERLSIFCVVKL